MRSRAWERLWNGLKVEIGNQQGLTKIVQEYHW